MIIRRAQREGFLYKESWYSKTNKSNTENSPGNIYTNKWNLCVTFNVL